MDKITKFVDFVTEVQELLGHCELRQFDSAKDSDVWKSTMKQGQNNFFTMKQSAGYNYFRCLDYIREQLKASQSNISEDYLDKSYFDFLDEQTRNGVDLSTACQTLLDGWNTLQLKKFKFLIPISQYNYREEINLGKIRIVRITDQILEQEFDVKDDLTEIMNSASLIKHNNTDIFAIVNVESLEQEQGEEIAYQLAERFVYAAKLIDPGSYVRLTRKQMVPINESILHKEEGSLSGERMHSYNLPVRITPSEKFYNNLQPYWNKLAKFLYSDNLNDLQEVILSALYWYGEADVYTDARVKLYSNLITGLEWIVLHTYGKAWAKGKPFGENCAVIFSGDIKYWEFWRDYYDKRNDITHQKLVEIYKEEIDTLRLNLRKLLLRLIEFTDNHNSVKDVFDKEFGIK